MQPAGGVFYALHAVLRHRNGSDGVRGGAFKQFHGTPYWELWFPWVPHGRATLASIMRVVGSAGESRWLRCAVAVGFGLFLLGCSSEDHPPKLDEVTQVPTRRLPSPSPAWKPHPCWGSPPAGYAMDCGWVEAPENPHGTSGNRVKLAVARIFSKAESPANDPVVYLEGGPGGAAIQSVMTSFSSFEPLLKQRDLLVFDQRGAGLSEPSLSCAREFSTTTNEQERLSRCQARITGAGIDLSAYNTRNNAADTEAVRVALGYPTWNLYGISYGTKLALTVARDYPDGLRSMVIDSVVPLEADLVADTPEIAQSAFSRVFAACEAQAKCHSAYPDLMGSLIGLLTQLTQSPAQITSSAGQSYLIGPDEVLSVLYLMLYSAETVTYVPATVQQLADGTYKVITAVLDQLSQQEQVSLGMYLSMICGDEIPFTSREKLAEVAQRMEPHFAAHFASPNLFDDCARWNVPASPASENEPVKAGVNTLVISGEFDPITPPAYGAQVVAQLRAGRAYELSGEAHGGSLDTCGSQLVTSFLNAPGARPSDGCVNAPSSPDFLVRSQSPGEDFRGGFALTPLDGEDLVAVAVRLRRSWHRAWPRPSFP